MHGLADPVGAATALGAAALAALAWPFALPELARWCPVALGTASVALLHLASTQLVGAFQPGGGLGAEALLALGARQQGQVLLSALWAVVGTAALVVGLRRDVPALRRGALALLLVALAKVGLYDLATLTSLYRVGSCVVLGLVLLLAAFLWQRLRPRSLPDLREVPAALR